jgi:hypothetical protein
MKKVLFIIPPYFNADDYLNKNRAAVLPSFTMPYGILSMETYFSRQGDERYCYSQKVQERPCYLSLAKNK